LCRRGAEVLRRLTIDETAMALDVSAATVERDWTVAKAWLHQRLSPVTAARRAG
jgi:hypothetical protein